MSETQRPPGEHDSELPSERDAVGLTAEQRENAETSLEEPSDDAGAE